MEKRTYTKVKASEEFWQKELTNKIIDKTESKVQRINGDEVMIESINCTAEDDIIELSKQNPDHIFEAKYTGEDHFENLVSTYQYLNGSRKFIREEYEYCFCIRVSDRDKIDPELYERFQQKVIAYFKKVDNYRVRNDEIDPTFKDCPTNSENDDEDSLLTHTVEYREDNIILTAKKFGLTHIDISMRIINQHDAISIDVYTEYAEDGYNNF